VTLFIVLILVLVAISAFMSLAEIALVGISKIRLRHLVERKVPGAKLVEQLVAQLDNVITTILVWSNFLNATMTSLTTAACIYWLGDELGIWVSALLAGSIILLFTDILPKVYAARSPDRVSLRVAPIMWLLLKATLPISKAMTKVTNVLLKLLGVPISARSPLVTEEELRLMIELGKEEGFLGEHERRLLHRIFEFGDLKVKEVMIPRANMVVVRDTADHEEVLKVLTEQGHGRIPVYRDTPEKIVGIIYAQEILYILREGWPIILQDIIHPPFEVSPEMRVIDLLDQFQRNKVQIAIVVDKERRALGILTLEDLVEEIVGEVPEKHKEGW
jgi:CBS domain containing-hemolysin-like protein